MWQRKALASLSLLTLATLGFASAATAATSSWSFDPATYDFGTRMPSTGPSAAKAFTLTNTGDTTVGVAGVGIGWGGPPPLDPELFHITSDNCNSLAAGASCVIEVTFNPSTAGPKQGSLSVNTAAEEPPPTYVALSGEGAGPKVSISAESLRFESREVGTGTSSPQTLTVTNEGILDLEIAGIDIDGHLESSSAQFKVTGGTCNASLIVPPASSCTIEVVFAPVLAGFIAAELQIEDNAPGSPHSVGIEGLSTTPPIPSGPFGPSVIMVMPPPEPLPSAEMESRAAAAIAHRPKRITRSRNATFWFQPSSTAPFECELDERIATPCSAPTRYSNLRPGKHVFTVRAVGQNDDGATYRWRILSRR